MITLYGFGPGLGMADPSPFVVKAMMLLKLAGLDYEARAGDVRKAPKRKLPILDDDGEIVADSTFIRLHIERKYGFDFDRKLIEREAGIAWAAEKMCEDHLYWLAVRDRWADDANFEKGPAQFFEVLPAIARPLVKAIVRRQIRRALHAQGTGRHSNAEASELGRRAVGAIAAILGDKACLMGEEPCGSDATVYAFVAAGLCPVFDSSVRDAILAHGNLVAYCDRMTARWFPEFAAQK